MNLFRTYAVRVVAPDDLASATPHFASSEDEALEAMARAVGFPSYRAWQAEHPGENGWSVVVEAVDTE